MIFRIPAAAVAFSLFILFTLVPVTVLADSHGHPANRISNEVSKEPEDKGNFLNWPYLTGDWGGGRTWLKDKAGIQLISNFVIDYVGNPVGGKLYAARESSCFFAGLNFDWSKWWSGLEGFQLQVSMIWRFGDSLSNDAIGNQFQVQQDYGGHGVFLYDLWIKKSFKDGRYYIRFGRIAQGDDFLANPLFWAYVNNAFDGNPVAIFLNSPIQAYPHATWGAMAYVNPIDEWYAKVGVYGADTRLNMDSWHGAYMGFDFNMGAYVMLQTGYRLNKGKGSRGLPGEYSVGGYYSSASMQVIGGAPDQKINGVFGGYFMIDQMLYREIKGSDQGLYIWSSFIIGPENTSTMPYFLSGGLQYKGPLARRDRDKVVLGAAWGKFSPNLARSQRNAGQLPQDYEIVLELDYLCQLTPFFYFEPDFQYIINPGGRGDIPNAVVLGFQSGLVF
jgi:porin